MKQFLKVICMVLVAALLLPGCVMRTVDELYCLPKRPQADSDLQKVIDQAMVGLSYCAPVYGENRQMLQAADLDGDGVNEYVVLARNVSQNVLKILVFRQLAGGYVWTDTIDSYGSAFDFITFENTDDHPGAEIIVGRQMGDGAVRSAAVYRMDNGTATRLLEVSYLKFLAHDMDEDGRSELMLIHPGDSGAVSSNVMLYRYEDGEIRCTSQLEIANAVESVKQMECIVLEGGVPAVLVASRENDVQTLEVFNFKSGKLNHVYGPVMVEKLNNHFVYPFDADNDGDTDLPEVLPIMDAAGNPTGQNWIRWYGLSAEGNTTYGMYTYYSYADKWYLHMEHSWTKELTVTRSDGVCTFTNLEKEIVMTIYALTGSNRNEQAEQLGGAVLGSSESVTFVAVIGPGAQSLGITAHRLSQMFYPIELKLYTEED